jgi:hypothetical protein
MVKELCTITLAPACFLLLSGVVTVIVITAGFRLDCVAGPQILCCLTNEAVTL